MTSSPVEESGGQDSLTPALAYDPQPPIMEIRPTYKTPSGLVVAMGWKLPGASLSAGSFVLSGTYS
jgi:hypothetical protein